MEGSVATPTAPAEPHASYDGSAEATNSTEQLFQWSGYVHVGTGAEQCEHRSDGACTETEHFHGWVCLPNPYQVRDIADKARAARARKARAMRDAGDPNHSDPKRHEPSDSYMVLESELDTYRQPHEFKLLIQSIAARTIERSLMDILDDLHKDERFEHHAQDTEEFRRQQELPEDQRDEEEYTRLQEDLLDYGKVMQEEIDKRIATEVAHLESIEQDAVIDLERQFRIDTTGTEAYLHAYYTWAIYTGTRKPSTEGFPSERKFDTPLALSSVPPEVVTALRQKIRTLEERTSGRGEAAGN
jgi:hypothetical protein